ncbi:DsbA family protein [Morganella psychrotolerans]|uniref:Copper resistance protein n=1 Tax=Morganella psychrotolerans TaxID=368603 RepID=A0A1B8HDI8_9GAMM|nr:DsbA family protein [Morganella psychrotolerans]OBU07144.1 copper resistance protein [Morganella psychrotolerans]
MKKTLAALIIGSLFFTATANAAALTAGQEAQVRELVRDTLVKNPEILEEAIAALQQKQNEKQSAQVKDAVKANADALFNDKYTPRIGSKTPKLTIVSFTDYNCPYCKRFDPQLEAAVKNNPDIAVVFKLLPFKGESSLNSSRAALSVWETKPEAFVQLHNRFMQKKTALTQDDIDKAMKTANVSDVKITENSMNTMRMNMMLAEQLGVQGTPATLIGDVMLPGAVDDAQLDAVIKEELAKVK